jgi:hypothetical protein
MHRAVPDDIRRFILTSVPSVPFLEAMLLLRSEARASWDPAALARRLYLQPNRAGDLLRQLADAGFIASSADGWHWQPAPDAVALVDDLAHLYSENLLGVTALIHSREERRAHQFADAFRLRKDEPGKEE